MEAQKGWLNGSGEAMVLGGRGGVMRSCRTKAEEVRSMGESGGGSSGRVEMERGRNLDESFNLHYGGIIMNREIVGSKSSLTTFKNNRARSIP